MASRKPPASKQRKGASRKTKSRGAAADTSASSGEESDADDSGAGQGDEDVEAEVLVGEVVGVADSEVPTARADAALEKLAGPPAPSGKGRKSVVVHDPLAAYIQETRQFPDDRCRTVDRSMAENGSTQTHPCLPVSGPGNCRDCLLSGVPMAAIQWSSVLCRPIFIASVRAVLNRVCLNMRQPGLTRKACMPLLSAGR